MGASSSTSQTDNKHAATFAVVLSSPGVATETRLALVHAATEATANLALGMVAVKTQAVFANPETRPPGYASLKTSLPYGGVVVGVTATCGPVTMQGTVQPRDEAEALHKEAAELGVHTFKAGPSEDLLGEFTIDLANFLPGPDVHITFEALLPLLHEATGDGRLIVIPAPLAPWTSITVTVTPDTNAVHELRCLSHPLAAVKASSVPVGDGRHALQLAYLGSGTAAGRATTFRVLVRVGDGGDTGGPPTTLILARSLVHARRAEMPVLAGAGGGAHRPFALDMRPPAVRRVLLLSDGGVATRDHRADAGLQDTAAMLQWTPTADMRATFNQALPRTVAFVVDVSGSMTGTRLRTAVDLMKTLIESLREQDTFHLVAFSSTAEQVLDDTKGLCATRENVEVAWRALDALRAHGGTNLLAAVAMVKELLFPEGGLLLPAPPSVFIITDGDVSDSVTVVKSAQELHTQFGALFFTMAIGKDADRMLCANIAHFGGGRSVAVTDALSTEPDVPGVLPADQLTAVARTFLTTALAPVATNLQLDWGTLAPHVLPELCAPLHGHQPALFAGDTLTACALLTPGADASLRAYTGPHVLTVTANRADGAPITAWLMFPATGTAMADTNAVAAAAATAAAIGYDPHGARAAAMQAAAVLPPGTVPQHGILWQLASGPDEATASRLHTQVAARLITAHEGAGKPGNLAVAAWLGTTYGVVCKGATMVGVDPAAAAVVAPPPPPLPATAAAVGKARGAGVREPLFRGIMDRFAPKGVVPDTDVRTEEAATAPLSVAASTLRYLLATQNATGSWDNALNTLAVVVGPGVTPAALVSEVRRRFAGTLGCSTADDAMWSTALVLAWLKDAMFKEDLGVDPATIRDAIARADRAGTRLASNNAGVWAVATKYAAIVVQAKRLLG